MSSKPIHLLVVITLTTLSCLVVPPAPHAVAADDSTADAPQSAESSADHSDPTDREKRADDDATELVPFGFDFLPFVGTSSALPDARRTVSVNLVGGISGGIEALELGGALNLTTGPVDGAQLSGAGNLVTGDLSGLQAAGAVNITGDSLTGAQLAGAANVTGGNSESQLAGAVNITGGQFAGAQLSGAANIAGAGVTGLQASGALNITGGTVHGAQLGVVNIAADDVNGTQIGVVNIAKNSTASIGLISILADGFFDIETVGSEEGLLLTGIRHGGDHVYNVYSVGLRAGEADIYPATALGIGWRHELSDSLEISTDILGVQQYRQDFSSDQSNVLLAKLRPMLAWRPSPFIAIVGGPTLTVSRADADIPATRRPSPPWSTWQLRDGDPTLRMWPGFTLGARLL